MKSRRSEQDRSRLCNSDHPDFRTQVSQRRRDPSTAIRAGSGHPATSRKRSGAKQTQTTAAPWVPPHPTLASLRKAAANCKGCDLWKRATQTVFGEGKPGARIMLVGEQPGDREDIEGRPFVGAAGKLLDAALQQAGIDRREVYVTNTVKHFKWVPQERGKRRIHKKPRDSEIKACRPWLDAEIAVVKPQVLVCLGATAAQSLLGKDFRVSQRRGELLESSLAPHVMATVHPSSILRARDEDSRRAQMGAFVDDLRKAARILMRGAAA